MGVNDQRPRFFEGQYLSAADLSAVVDYLRDSQARHALGASTWGIGIGLNLTETPASGPAARQEVILQPGWALDGFARHLVVQQPTRLPETLFAAVPYNASVDAPGLPGGPIGRLVKVWLSYTETAVRPPAPGFEICNTSNANSRIEEGVEFMIGEFPVAQQRAPLVIGAETVDALDALKRFDPTAASLYDTSVPHQTFPCGNRPPRWLVPLGLVRWVAGQGVTGYFVDRDLVSAAQAPEMARAFRRYIGVVTQVVEAADAALVLRRRNDRPDDPHRYEQQLASGQLLAALDQDLLWVEGGMRALGDVKLAGSRLLLRNPDGLDEGNQLYLARAGDASGLPGRRELRAVIGSDAQPDNRFVIGPELGAPAGGPGPLVAPRFVVVSSGRVGVGIFDPAAQVHVRGDAIRLEDAAAAKRIDMRTDGAAVELRSDTNSLHLLATGPSAQNADRVIINPVGVTNGAVGIGTDDPQFGLDVNEPAVRFRLERGNGGSLVLQTEQAAAARDRVYLEASIAAGGAPSPELRVTGPLGVNVPLFSAFADTTYLRGKLGVNEPAPAAETQMHVRGRRIRLQSVDGTRSVDLRADGSAVDLQSGDTDLYLRSASAAGGAARNIVMNPFAGDGNVGIGLMAPLEKLHVQGHWLRVDGNTGEQCMFGGDGNSAVTMGTLNPAIIFADMRNLSVPWGISVADAGAWLTVYCRTVVEVSDARAKTSIQPISDALTQVSKLRGVTYQWAAEGARRQDGERLGMIAQEVQQVVPQAVTTSERGAGIAYSSLVSLLVEAVKELRTQVQDLQAQVAGLNEHAPGSRPAMRRATAKAAVSAAIPAGKTSAGKTPAGKTGSRKRPIRGGAA